MSSNLDELLKRSAFGNKIDDVKLYLSRGANPNWKDLHDYGNSALHRAAQNGHKDAVSLLLQYGADPNIQNDGGGSALSDAVWYGHLETVLVFLKHGADTNIQDNNGWCALHKAALNKYEEIVKELIYYGADVNLKNSDGKIAFDLTDCQQIKDFILNLPYTQIMEKKGTSLVISLSSLELKNKELKAAVKQGDIDKVNILLSDTINLNWKDSNDYQRSALHNAAEEGHANIANLLLNKGADVNITDNAGKVPLYLSAYEGHNDTVIVLLQHGADINIRDNNENSALHIAVLNGNNNIALLLIDKGADIALQDKDGNTALHFAASKGRKSLLELLLHRGIDRNIKNKDGKTAYDLANSTIKTFMVEIQNDIAALENKLALANDLKVSILENDIDKVISLLAKGADPNTKDMNNLGRSMIHLSAENGRDDILGLLIQYGVDINTQDQNGFTALHLAAFFGLNETLELLLKNNANINIKNKDGNTALNLASNSGKDEIVFHLIEKGANLDLQDNDGFTALHHAASKGRKIVIELLIQKGANLNIHNNVGEIALDIVRDRDHMISQISKISDKAMKVSSLLDICEILPGAGYDKFNCMTEYFVFGSDEDYKHGLTNKIKSLDRSMREECSSNEEGRWLNEFNYVVNEPAREQIQGVNRIRDEGHSGMRSQDFVNHSVSSAAKLTQAEVASLRLYTGPLYQAWNTSLRLFTSNPDLLTSWSTCVAVLYSAIFKLSYLSRPALVYRGVNETFKQLPPDFLAPKDRYSFAGGVELAFMSTTLDKNVAIEYAKKGTSNHATIFEIPFDAASRGASVQWVSQYPYENELLYPPCTYLTTEKVSMIDDGPGKGMRLINLRAAISTARINVDNIKTIDDHN